MLNGLGFVERYAWFSLPTRNGSGGIGSGLYTDAGAPTVIGEAYRAA